MLGDIVGRAAMAKGLTLDTKGKLEAMNVSVGYSDDAGVDFGDEVKRLAERLDELPEVCTACLKQREGGKPLLIYARCKDEKYCSPECQKKRWKSHKKEWKEGGIDIE